MAVMFQPWLPLYLFLLAFIISALPFSHCQFGSPQNIETFYPFDQAPSPNSVPQPPIVRPFPPATPPQPAPTKSSTTGKIVKAVAATAAGTLVVSALLFFLVHRGFAARRRGTQGSSRSSDEGPPAAPRNEFSRVDGDLKGFIVDEDGLDVLYWRKLEGRNSKKCTFRKEVLKKEEQEQEDRRRKSERQEVPLLRGKSSASHVKVVPEVDDPNGISPSTPPPPSSPPPTPTPTPPPPPPPPPPPFLAVSAVKRPAPPPLPPRTGGSNTSLKPPPARPKGVVGNNQPGESSSGTENGHVKMKPLHWDKVNTNTDHSMVWDKIDAGSFRFDGDLMEHLFGYVATNNKSPERNSNSVGRSSHNSYPPAQIFILDPRRSQNIAIVLKSLAISRKGIVAALIDGHGLDTDTLEKLVRIAPSNEEHAQILEYEGDLTRLADAESFLYHLLKAVPSAFTRLNAMLFRTNYDLEILFLKQSIQTLELGCKELKTRGLFMKLLEATLKAGNRMNAGTARGNAQAFDLNALRKLSDVKSSDGRTTLLHFVVEEVVRSEGKRCVLSRNRSMSRSMSRGGSTYNPESLTTNEERDKEYKLLGLPIVGGLSAEFSNVKKAATIDYDTFASTSAALTAHAAEIRALNSQCANDRGGGFVREMEGFLEAAEEELKVLREEETRVMDLVKKTTEYYQAGASKDKAAPPLQLFVIVKDFLSMVDQVCVEIVRSLQKRRTVMTTLGSSSPNSPPPRGPVRFPNLPENFMSDKSMSSSSESDDF